jgi:hypothetical protein
MSDDHIRLIYFNLNPNIVKTKHPCELNSIDRGIVFYLQGLKFKSRILYLFILMVKFYTTKQKKSI